MWGSRMWGSRNSICFPVLLVSWILLLLPPHIFSQSPYPVLHNLSYDDALFRQLAGDVARAYRSEAGSGEAPPLQFFRYTTGDADSIYSIASRCSLPYESIVSLNGLTGPNLEHPEDLLIPNRPGLFLPLSSPSDLDILEHSRQVLEPPSEVMAIRIFRFGAWREYHFFPERRFSPLQRAYFLGILFRLPLEKGVLSSSYGVRAHPFTGDHTFHHGIDLAAPRGSEVRPARAGIVQEKGFDPILGNYLVIGHEGSYETLYGHLDFSTVELKMGVGLSTIIGVVGSTGLSTGPHLHFEIRQGGESRDPERFLPEIDR